MNNYKSLSKRIFDFIFSFLLIPMLFPLWVVIIFCIMIIDGFPIFFTQKRVGVLGKEFSIFKFRTMRVGTPDMSTEDILNLRIKAITPLGNFLRRTSIDETPQVFNILRGEMSFVGPRPALPSQTNLIDGRQMMGIDMSLPGLTGIAQAKGRDNLTINHKLKYERFYLQNSNICLDLYILFFLTPSAIFSNRGNK